MKARVCACLKLGARSVEGTEAPGGLAEEFAYYCPFGPRGSTVSGEAPIDERLPRDSGCSRSGLRCGPVRPAQPQPVRSRTLPHSPGRTRVVPVATSTLAGADHGTHAQSAEAEVADTSRQNSTSRTH